MAEDSDTGAREKGWDVADPDKPRGSGGSRWNFWSDIVFKGVVTAAAAYGTYHIGSLQQTDDSRHKRQAQQNDDVRLVVDMISGDAAHRAIALAIAKSYAGDRIPVEVYEALDKYIISSTPRSEVAQNNSVAAQVSLDAAAATTSLQPSSLPIRVYIQFHSADGKSRANEIRQSLNGQQINGKLVIVPPVEEVKTAVENPILKCFRKSECDQFGEQLVTALKASGAPQNLVLAPTRGLEGSTAMRANHFEAWF